MEPDREETGYPRRKKVKRPRGKKKYYKMLNLRYKREVETSLSYTLSFITNKKSPHDYLKASWWDRERLLKTRSAIT